MRGRRIGALSSFRGAALETALSGEDGVCAALLEACEAPIGPSTTGELFVGGLHGLLEGRGRGMGSQISETWSWPMPSPPPKATRSAVWGSVAIIWQ